jgi:hypothetical protein
MNVHLPAEYRLSPERRELVPTWRVIAWRPS